MKKNKAVAVTLTATLAVTAMFAGTYAWNSISQKARNQVEQTVNPGARLHDDFNFLSSGNKDVYVENFTTTADSGVPVYARIRLDEYLEIGTDAGDTSRANDDNVVIVADTGSTPKLKEESTWTTYKWEREKLIENSQTPLKQNEPSAFRQYFVWNQKGDAQTTAYMPTFNKDKDSLEADINGTLEGKDGKKTHPYDDNIDYVAGEKVTNIAIYDVDDNEDHEADGLIDKVIAELTEATTKTLTNGTATERDWKSSIATAGTNTVSVDGASYGYNVVMDNAGSNIEYIDVALDANKKADYNVRLIKEEHTAVETLSGGSIISMDKWKALGSKSGAYWVYDTDGWVYWAQPIEPSTATSLLLDKIEIRNDTTIEDKYYYAINVVAQFSTKSEDGTWKDFADASSDAKLLLNNASDVAYDKYTVKVTSNGTDTTVNAAQDSSIQLSAAVTYGATAQTPNISWSVERKDGSAKASGTTFTNITGGTKNAVLKIGMEPAGSTLVVTATHIDATGCYGVGTFEVVVTENTRMSALRSEIATKAANVTTGTYKADSDVTVTIGGQDWYIIAKDDDTNPTKALLYAASSLDYDGTGLYIWGDGFSDNKDNKWINSNIRKYLNGSFIEGNTAYQGNSFADKYEDAFALAEPTTIYTRKSEGANSKNGTEDFIETTDKVFLLSETDLYNSFRGKYTGGVGYQDLDPQLYDYTVTQMKDGVLTGIGLWDGANSSQRKDAITGKAYYLRSPIHISYYSSSTDAYGNLAGSNVNSDSSTALRPVFWVDISQ